MFRDSRNALSLSEVAATSMRGTENAGGIVWCGNETHYGNSKEKH